MIPLFRPSCSDLEIKYVTEVLRSGWWGTGPVTEKLEHHFAEYVGARHAVAVASCTAGLQLACQAVGVAGGEVITPALTFASTALAPMHAGASVRFGDIDEATLCLDWDEAAAGITGRTRAIIPVWHGGTVTRPPDLFQLPVLEAALAGVPVIEDCAHAAGSARAGKLGIAACWSFHAVKNLAAGDGGMITTNDAGLAARLRRLRWCGIDRSTWDREGASRYAWEYDITEPGHKAQMNDITAAIALAQLERLPDMNEARRRIVRRYLDELAGLDWLRLPKWRDDSSWHLFTVRVDAGRRDRFIEHMRSRGVSAGVHYRPLNTFAIFPRDPLPVTDRTWGTLVTLPLFPDLADADVDQVISAVRGFA